MILEHQISILEWFLKDHVTEDISNGHYKLHFEIYQYTIIYYIYF